MRILLTNVMLSKGTGTETIVRDLVLALRRRGHVVICFAPEVGRLGARIRATGTPVVASLSQIADPPDIIHGHHSGPTMTALARFPDAQAVFVCHDWSAIQDDPPIHPRIRRYLYVRHVLRERLVSEKGIAPGQVQFLANTIDLARLDMPKVPPSRPRTAGVYARAGVVPFLDILAGGCAARGVKFVGELLADADDVVDPEKTLSRCDLVFASGRIALEALAAGCAVINADRFGIGGLVTSARLDAFIPANFAIGALSGPPSERLVARILDAYDAADVTAVTERVRRECDAGLGAERLEAIYRDVLAEAADQPADRMQEAVALGRFLEENLQRGLLYNAEVARRQFNPEPEVELFETVRRLNLAVDDLTKQIRHLPTRRISLLFSSLWRAIRPRGRKRND
jgi:hypothetical protein